MRLVMTLKVRDEEDVLEDNLRFHHALGVDHFLVTDNGSVDGTRDILAAFERAGLASVTVDESDDLRAHGAEWYTRMAREAATEHGADWVFHNDADEFWWPSAGNLKDVLAEIDEAYGAVVCPRTEFIGRPDDETEESFVERLTYRERLSSLQPKVIHRADPDAVVLHRGGHEVASVPGGDAWKALRPPGRAVHRGLRDESDEEEPGNELAWAPSWPVRILHFPLRSAAQFRRRIEVSMHSGGYREGGRFRRLAEAYEAGTSVEMYEELVVGDAELEAELAANQIVEDRRLADLLPLCPDPLRPGTESGSVHVEWDEDRTADEREALTHDAMRLLARTHRFQMVQIERQRKKIDELKAADEGDASEGSSRSGGHFWRR